MGSFIEEGVPIYFSTPFPPTSLCLPPSQLPVSSFPSSFPACCHIRKSHDEKHTSLALLRLRILPTSRPLADNEELTDQEAVCLSVFVFYFPMKTLYSIPIYRCCIVCTFRFASNNCLAIESINKVVFYT